MTASGIQILGAPELSAQLAGMASEIQGSIATAALTAGGIVLQTAWKEAIEHYPLIDTGSYLRSIGQEIIREGDMLQVYVGTDIVDPPYPFFLEYGTSKMSAKVHVRPAMDTAGPKAQSEVEQVFAIFFGKF